MPLRLRLALGAALGTAALIAVVGLAFVLQLRASLDATLDVALASRATAITEAYRTRGPAALATVRDGTAQILDATGRVVAASPGDGAGPALDRTRLAQLDARTVDGSGPLTFTTGEDETRTRHLATVLSDADGTVLVVSMNTAIAEAADRHVDRGLMVGGPVAALAAGVGAWWLAGAALRPVERMRRQSAALAAHDDGSHLAVPTTADEVSALAVTLNALLDRQRRALARERRALDAERGFVADAGHELRTPLATLRAELELAARPGRGRDELAEAVETAAGETERLIRLAEDLLTLARVEGGTGLARRRPVDLVPVVAAATRAAAAHADPRGVDVVTEGPPRLVAHVDPDRARQALDNLLANAVRYSPEHGLVVVELARERDEAVVRVRDDGPGFPPEFLPHAFERFRRADAARARDDGGSGLGLAIVATIARAHGGSAEASNITGGGAIVALRLPGGAPVVADRSDTP